MTNTAPPRPDTSPNYIVSPYRCPICHGNSARYQSCEYPGCPDGRDQAGWRPYSARNEQERGPTSLPMAMKSGRFWPGVLLGLICALLVCALLAATGKAHAAKGFDPNTDPMAKWMETLLRPDYPYNPPDNVWPCCGKADAYPVSTYYINPDGSYSVIIADGSLKVYPDGTVRPAITTGRTLVVPSGKVNKVEDDLDNPTDFSWVFLVMHEQSNPDGDYTVMCFDRHPQGQ